MATTTGSPRLSEREPQLIVRDAAYALTALADDAVANVRTVTGMLEQLREDAPATLEARFDAKAAAGADRVAELRSNGRVARVETALEPVGEQLKIAQSQVKGAWTSVRRTIDAAVEAGRTQADSARSQVKAAATSTRKTIDAVVGAGRDIAG